jgi:hypothetical protein
MRPPFPGMDPWLEHPALWPGFHNRLIAAIADDLSPRVAPRYFVGVEGRTYLVTGQDLDLIGVVDAGVWPAREVGAAIAPRADPHARVAVAGWDVAVPVAHEVNETYLEVREAGSKRLVTTIELLSPANKLHRKRRRSYERKRSNIFQSRTSLVEVDLLRAGRPMRVEDAGHLPRTDYRILVSPAVRRPRASLHGFTVREPIPIVPVPLLPDDEEPPLDLGAILHALYDRARLDVPAPSPAMVILPRIAEVDPPLSEWVVGRDLGQSM